VSVRAQILIGACSLSTHLIVEQQHPTFDPGTSIPWRKPYDPQSERSAFLGLRTPDKGDGYDDALNDIRSGTGADPCHNLGRGGRQ
jgi:hypothetical protein